MKPAPNFKQWPDAVDGIWKIELLRWLGQQTKIDILFETGTCHGVTPRMLNQDFAEIYTIELMPSLFESAKEQLAPFPNVKMYHGSSRTMLSGILQTVPQRPILFWLDAHSSGPHTADDGDPLADELLVIMRERPDSLIVIDDMRDAELKHVVEMGVDFSGWHKEYRTGEVILYRDGQYQIPEFEA